MNQPAKFIRFLLPIIIIALSIAAFIFLYKTKPPTLQKVIEEKVWFVESQTIQTASHQPEIRLIAQIISTEDIEISSAIDADVAKRWIETGDRVKKGQKLLSLDQTTFKLIVDQRLAEQREIKAQIEEEFKQNDTNKLLIEKEKLLLGIANNGVNRAKTLEKSEMGSSSQLDDAKRTSLNQEMAIVQRQSAIDKHPIRLQQMNARLGVATSRLSLARNDLLHTEILAPINGTVTQILLDHAEHVRKGTSLVKLYNHEQLELKALIPEQYLPTLSSVMSDGKTLTGWIKENKQKYPVSLRRLSGEIQAKSAGSYLYFSFEKDIQNNMVLGKTVVLHLRMPTINNTISLSTDALYGTKSVFLIKAQRLQRVNVNWLGETRGSDNQLTFLIQSAALQNGDVILTSKFANAMNGLKVTIRNE